MKRKEYKEDLLRSEPFALVGLCFLCFLGVTVCSTDIDLTAPYERTPVVFSLLVAEKDTQWVRINRTWLGDGNQFEAAMESDSSEYHASDLLVG